MSEFDGCQKVVISKFPKGLDRRLGYIYSDNPDLLKNIAKVVELETGKVPDIITELIHSRESLLQKASGKALI